MPAAKRAPLRHGARGCSAAPIKVHCERRGKAGGKKEKRMKGEGGRMKDEGGRMKREAKG